MVCYVEGISAFKKIIKKRYIGLFDDHSPAAKDPVPPYTCLYRMFRNVYVHVQKRAADKYQFNVTDQNSGYFQCPCIGGVLLKRWYWSTCLLCAVRTLVSLFYWGGDFHVGNVNRVQYSSYNIHNTDFLLSAFVVRFCSQSDKYVFIACEITHSNVHWNNVLFWMQTKTINNIFLRQIW